ncbi:helix-turn-helix domain-containing protein [Stappia sp.]|jgi:AraC-like DNA-binding protein|uniref:helix-turn-helix domain-containing protein n=1 Tax=Stappia sp. TaxID=1870903 RepID=UPI003A9A05A3
MSEAQGTDMRAAPAATDREGPAGDGSVDVATTAIPRSVFTLDAVAPAERFALWRDSINCLFEVDAPREVRAQDFSARVESCVLGDIAVASTRTLAQSWARTPGVLARDGMDHFMIQIYERGRMRFSHRGQEREFGQNALVVFDLAQEMCSETTDMANLSLLLPRALLEPQLKHGADRHMQVLETAGNPLARLLFDHMKTLQSLSDQFSVPQAGEVSAASVALVAACLNGTPPEEGAREAGVAFSFLTRARQRIEEHLSDPDLTPGHVARLAGVSRTRLYEMFEPFGGVHAYIRERRLRMAMRMLVDPRFSERPISVIAGVCGFTNDSAFSRAFRTRFGITAREMRAGPVQNSPLAEGIGRPVDRRYESWVRTLST